jgi:hypothetical protein
MRTVIMADRNRTTEVAVVFAVLANRHSGQAALANPALAGIDRPCSPRIPNSPAGFPRVGARVEARVEERPADLASRLFRAAVNGCAASPSGRSRIPRNRPCGHAVDMLRTTIHETLPSKRRGFRSAPSGSIVRNCCSRAIPVWPHRCHRRFQSVGIDQRTGVARLGAPSAVAVCRTACLFQKPALR